MLMVAKLTGSAKYCQPNDRFIVRKEVVSICMKTIKPVIVQVIKIKVINTDRNISTNFLCFSFLILSTMKVIDL